MSAPAPIRLPETTRRLVDEAARVTPSTERARERLWGRLAATMQRRRQREARLPLACDLAVASLLLAVVIGGQAATATATATATSPPLARADRPTIVRPLPSPRPTLLAVGRGGTLALSDGASVKLLGGGAPALAFELLAGRAVVTAPGEAPPPPVRVLAGAFRVAGFARHFTVEVDQERIVLTVADGALRLERGGAAVEVGSGESVRSDDPRLTRIFSTPPSAQRVRIAATTPSLPPAAPAVRPTRPGRSDERATPVERGAPTATPLERGEPTATPLERREATFARCAALDDALAARACYQQLADGNDLVAANALFALGTLARDRLGRRAEALAHFRDYLRRWSDGALAPEAQLAVLEACIAADRRAEARDEADRFLLRYADHPGAARVRQLRATLEGAAPQR